MNKLQARYAAALAAKDTMSAEERAIEKHVLQGMNLADKDGKPVEYVFAIEDEELFREACERLETEMKRERFYERQAEIFDEYNAACNDLIEWALGYFGMYYPSEAEKLRKASKPGGTYRIRQQLIDYAFRADL